MGKDFNIDIYDRNFFLHREGKKNRKPPKKESGVKTQTNYIRSYIRMNIYQLTFIIFNFDIKRSQLVTINSK